MTMHILFNLILFFRLRQSVAVKELLNAKGKLNLSNGGGTDSVSDKQKTISMSELKIK